jgi:hypothetical protein
VLDFFIESSTAVVVPSFKEGLVRFTEAILPRVTDDVLVSSVFKRRIKISRVWRERSRSYTESVSGRPTMACTVSLMVLLSCD